MFEYKGIRIRNRHRHVSQRFIFYLMLPILFMMLGIFVFLSLFQWVWWAIGLYLLVSIGLAGMFAYACLYFFFYDVYERLVHKGKLADMIQSRRLIIEKVSKNGRRKVVYYPKIFYHYKDGVIHVRLPLDLGPFHERFNNLAGELEEAFFCDLVEEQREKNYVCYTFLCDVEKNRISIRDVVVKDGVVTLMKNVRWVYNKAPHGLVIGGTGGGKTYFLMTLIYVLMPVAIIDICDPKRSDLARLEALPIFEGHVFYDVGILYCLRKNAEEAIKRYEMLRESSEFELGYDYTHFGFKPHFLVIDEWLAYYASLEQSKKKEAMKYLNQIVLMGRQCGIFLLIGTQRPDTKYLDGAIRDNFGLRVTLGKVSKAGYKMIYENTLKSLFNKPICGRGYIDPGTEQVREFYSPYVDLEAFNFLVEFRKRSDQLMALRQKESEQGGES